MYLSVKLVLKVDDYLKEELEKYEDKMKHEIYRIAGVFKKNGRTFEFRYKNIDNYISWFSKELVILQAKDYFDNQIHHRECKLNFSSIWCEKSYVIEEGNIIAELGIEQKRRKIHIPFYVHQQQMDCLKEYKRKTMTIKKRNGLWYAYILVEVEAYQNGKDIIMGINVGIKKNLQ